MKQVVKSQASTLYPSTGSLLLPAGLATLLAIALVGCGGGGGGGGADVVIDDKPADPVIFNPLELILEPAMPASVCIDGEKYISVAETYAHDLDTGKYTFSNPALQDAMLYVYQHSSTQTANGILPAYPIGAWLLVEANSLNGDDYPLLQVIHEQITQTNMLENEKLILTDIQNEQLDAEEQAIFIAELEWALSTKGNCNVELTTDDLASSDTDPWDADVQALFSNKGHIDYFISFGEFDDLEHSAEEIQFIRDFFTSLDPFVELDFRQTTIFDEAEIGFYRYDLLYEDEEDLTIAETSFLENYDQMAIDWIRTDEGVVLSGYNKLASNDASTLAHEIGHALGLEHPRLDGYDLNFDQNDTVMSYNNAFSGWSYVFSAVDLARLEELWGKEGDIG